MDGVVRTSGDDAGRRLGAITAFFTYHALGRRASVIDALGGVTQYTYDEAGNRVNQTDANGDTTSFALDTQHWEGSRTSPDGAMESRTYDLSGRIQTRTDFAGIAAQYSYNLMGRLLSRSYPDSSSVGFTYTVTDQRGITAYTHDNRGRVVAHLDAPDQWHFSDRDLRTYKETTGIEAREGMWMAERNLDCRSYVTTISGCLRYPAQDDGG